MHLNLFNAECLNGFAQNHPRAHSAILEGLSMGLELGCGYLYGRCIRVSPISIVAHLAVGVVFREVLLLAIGKTHPIKDPFGSWVRVVVIHGLVGGITLGHLQEERLIKPMGAIAYIGFLSLKMIAKAGPLMATR